MANFTGQLRTNEIFSALYNMIISQEVFADNIKGTFSELVDMARVDGSLYGDQKLYYASDALKSSPWGNDAEAENLLKLHRPKAPKCQAIVLDQFRKIAVTVDDYLSKRAWGNEYAFSQFNSVILGWIRDTKRIYDSTLYNVFIGTNETNIGKQEMEVTLPTVADNEEAENRLQAQTIGQAMSNLLIRLRDVSRDYNDYGFIRSYNEDDFLFVFNGDYLNKITNLDLPTIFHKDIIKKLGQYTLPARYFGKVLDKTTLKADGLTIRSLYETDVTIAKEYTDETGTVYKVGDTFHLYAGDLIPADTVIATAAGVTVPAYKEDSTIIFKVIHKRSAPYMSAFEVGTSFYNPLSLTTNQYLIFGHNTIEHLKNYPFITVRGKAE